MKNTLGSIVLYLWFYIGWFLIVYLATSPYVWLTPLIAFVSFLINLKYKLIRFSQVKFLITLLIIGLIFDFSMIQLQLIKIKGDSFFGLPIWLLSLWILFVLSVFPLIKVLSRYFTILSFIAGGIGGYLSYLAGVKFGLIELTSRMSHVVYFIFWGFYFMFIVWKYKNLSQKGLI